MTPLRRALIGLGIAGVVLGLLTSLVTLTSEHESDRGLDAALALMVSWSFLGAGLLAWDRRPSNLVGPLMVAVGMSWFLTNFEDSNTPGIFAVGVALGSLPFAFLAHMLFSFPSGRLETRPAQFLVPMTYAMLTVLPVAAVFFLDPAGSAEGWDCGSCPENPLMISDQPGVVDAIFGVVSVIGVIATTALIVHLFRSARRAGDRERRRDGPVWWAGFVTMFLLATLLLLQLKDKEPFAQYIYYFALLCLTSVPVAFVLGGFRVKLNEADQVAAENVRLDAELQARLDELRESRARIVEAADAARRKLERDLHDGAQQRLVGLALDLRLARSKLDDDPAEAARVLDEAQAELARATEELRELARGIHPAVLSDRGLGAAIDALASRCPLPVALDARLDVPLAQPVEAAAYFVVSEALTNVVRYAGAERASVSVVALNGELSVEVRDDGRGGADPAGSGLRGLADRIAALDGRLGVVSPRGGGTIVRASIPTAVQGAPSRPEPARAR